MKAQKITVTTKGGLLAAFECAKDYYGPTHIAIKRKLKDGLIILSPSGNSVDTKTYIKNITAAKKKIRRISAKELLS